jgi:hypothetical protein
MTAEENVGTAGGGPSTRELSSRAHHILVAPPATNAGCPIRPDFLRRLVALIQPMRLSLMKGAHALFQLKFVIEYCNQKRSVAFSQSS